MDAPKRSRSPRAISKALTIRRNPVIYLPKHLPRRGNRICLLRSLWAGSTARRLRAQHQGSYPRLAAGGLYHKSTLRQPLPGGGAGGGNRTGTKRDQAEAGVCCGSWGGEQLCLTIFNRTPTGRSGARGREPGCRARLLIYSSSGQLRQTISNDRQTIV